MRFFAIFISVGRLGFFFSSASSASRKSSSDFCNDSIRSSSDWISSSNLISFWIDSRVYSARPNDDSISSSITSISRIISFSIVSWWNPAKVQMNKSVISVKIKRNWLVWMFLFSIDEDAWVGENVWFCDAFEEIYPYLPMKSRESHRNRRFIVSPRGLVGLWWEKYGKISLRSKSKRGELDSFCQYLVSFMKLFGN